MVAADPSLVALIDCPSETGADTSQLEDGTTEATDDLFVDIIATNIWKIGKAPDDAMRCEWTEDQADIASGDTIVISGNMLHNFGDGELLAYTDATNVTKTDQLNATPVSDVFTFTLTAAFITQLGDQGAGAWAVRFMEKDSFQAGDVSIQEVDADLTVSVATVYPPWPRQQDTTTRM